MAGFPGVAHRPEQRLAAHDHPGADPDLPRHVDEVLHARVPPAPVLTQGAQVRFVGHRHGLGEVEFGGEQRSDRDVPPAEVGGEMQEAVGAAGDASHSDADAHECVGAGERRQKGPGQVGSAAHRVLRGEVLPRAGDPDPVVDVAAQADRGCGNRVYGQLDGEDDGSVRSNTDDGGTVAPAPPPPGRAPLPPSGGWPVPGSSRRWSSG